MLPQSALDVTVCAASRDVRLAAGRPLTLHIGQQSLQVDPDKDEHTVVYDICWAHLEQLTRSNHSRTERLEGKYQTDGSLVILRYVEEDGQQRSLGSAILRHAKPVSRQQQPQAAAVAQTSKRERRKPVLDRHAPSPKRKPVEGQAPPTIAQATPLQAPNRSASSAATSKVVMGDGPRYNALEATLLASQDPSVRQSTTSLRGFVPSPLASALWEPHWVRLHRCIVAYWHS